MKITQSTPEMDVPAGRDDPAAEASLIRAMDRLTESNKQLIEDNNIGVEIVHDDVPFLNNGFPYGAYFVFSDGERTIRIYSYMMRLHQRGYNINTPDEFDDWMYRLVLHELGHVRGETDAEMAERHGY